MSGLGSLSLMAPFEPRMGLLSSSNPGLKQTNIEKALEKLGTTTPGVRINAQPVG